MFKLLFMKDPLAIPRGTAIRRARKAQKMNLVDLAEKTGFSLSFISQVERGLTNPSINSLRKIALALGIPLSSFFEEALATEGPVLRKNERTGSGQYAIQDSHINSSPWITTAEWTFSSPGLRWEPSVLKPPWGTKETKQPSSFREYVVLILENKQYELSEGDSIYITENTPHRITNIGNVPLTIISAISPPGF